MNRNLQLAWRLKRAGVPRYALRMVIEAKRAGIPVSLGVALVEQESGWANLFGRDGVPNPIKGGKVTKKRYLEYKRYRNRGLGAQGVGPCQLTYPGFQDKADRLGGCYVPRHNIRVGFEVLANLRRTWGHRTGIARYNGMGAAADRYRDEVLRKAQKWHKVLS